jgi:hypothetical protein
MGDGPSSGSAMDSSLYTDDGRLLRYVNLQKDSAALLRKRPRLRRRLWYRCSYRSLLGDVKVSGS